MSRCDYDGVFYRVFCVTLLATAFTFTVILTNVFIDIDGLLAKKTKQGHENERNGNEVTTPIPSFETTDEIVSDKNDIDDHPQADLRTKRSLDTSNFLMYMKKHKMKKIYTRQLEKLLGQLNRKDEDYVDDVLNEDVPKTTVAFGDKSLNIENYKEQMKYPNDNFIKQNLFVPNDIINQGNKPKPRLHHPHPKVLNIEDRSANSSNEKRIKLNKVKKPHRKAMENLSESNATSDNNMQNSMSQKESNASFEKTYKTITPNSTNVTKKLISFLPEKSKVESPFVNKEPQSNLNVLQKDAQLHDDTKQNYFTLGENDLNVLFKLKEWDEQFKNKQQINNNPNKIHINDSNLLKNSENNFNPQKEVSIELKNNRSKRHIKLRHDDYGISTPRIKPCRNGLKKTDDDLYVEIETHFDGKGARGERKKKLVRNLIDRIQKAIRYDTDSLDTDKRVNKIDKHLQIKKRIQDPIKHKHKPLSHMSHYDSIEHRKLNPLNDMLEMRDVSPDLKDVSPDLKDVSLQENLEEPYAGYVDSNTPLTNLEKSLEITNAEINNVLNSGVPQRFQVPLNTDDVIGNSQVQNTFADTGNVTLFIKDIDGSGFAVGFNQYMDEPPDVESMKIFSGLENVIKNYHDNYDQNPGANDIDNSIERRHELPHELTKRNIPYDQNRHVLLRRAVQELDNEGFHSNAYNLIYDKKFLPYKKYQDIVHIPNKKAISDYEYRLRNYNYNPKNIKIVTKDIKIKALPLILDDDIFEKKLKLKPSDIFSLASILLNNNRKKRTVNVQRITNLKSRIKLNRYLNTKAMQSKKVFFKNKRSKRQIDKIRIIASDHLHHSTKSSDENIYIVPGGNLFGKRAVLREIELPESDTVDDRGEEQGEDPIPYNLEEPNPDQNYHPNIFESKYSRSSLMSKYPHLFTDGAIGSKEMHFGNENSYLMNDNKPSLGFDNLLGISSAPENVGSGEKHIPGIVDAILPSPSKNTYKVTVKILPKNMTSANSGFKEMHTVINKTYNNNGLQYYSLVNVSEISKIEKINKSKESSSHQFVKMTNTAQEQEEKMKFLLGLHKMKIEQQLQHLNKEKDNLEAILRNRANTKESEYSDFFKGVIRKDNDGKHVTSDPYIAPVQVQEIVTTEPTTTSTSTTTIKIIEPVSTPKLETKPEPVKTKIESSIKENENFTNEILSRINRNTDILQTFLMKLAEKLDPTPRYQTTTQQVIVDHFTEEVKHLKAHADLAKDLGMNLHHMHDSFFMDHHHHKNDSHYAIPFVYAYQQPYLSPNKPLLPMAKVVYHGHIHTNTIHKHAGDNWKYNPNNSKLTHSSLKHDNGTKFFIDPMARNHAAVSPKAIEMLDCKHNHTATINIR